MLDIITADALAPLAHGFFTRGGGASSGIFRGLNCGTGSTDLAEVVAINRARVAAALDVTADRLLTLRQVHSARVVTVDGPLDPRPEADAMVTSVRGLALGILTADCLPVLFADGRAGVVGAAHAGWRGLLAGVLEATLDAMEGLGADRARTCAVVGPAIGQGAYEVGPELRQAFVDADPSSARFFVPGPGDRTRFDLPGCALSRLRAAGVGGATWTGHCTYTDAERFYSFRRATHLGEADYGRSIAAIRL